MLNLITNIYKKARDYEYEVVHQVLTDTSEIKKYSDEYASEIREIKLLEYKMGNELIFFTQKDKENVLEAIIRIYASVLIKNINSETTGHQLKQLCVVFKISDSLPIFSTVYDKDGDFIFNKSRYDPYNIYQYVKSFTLDHTSLTMKQMSRCLLCLGLYTSQKHDITFIEFVNDGIKNIDTYSKYDLCVMLSHFFDRTHNHIYSRNFNTIKYSLFENWGSGKGQLSEQKLREILYQLTVIKDTYVTKTNNYSHSYTHKTFKIPNIDLPGYQEKSTTVDISKTYALSHKTPFIDDLSPYQNTLDDSKTKNIDPMIFTLISDLIDELYRSDGESSAITPILNFDGMIEAMDEIMEKDWNEENTMNEGNKYVNKMKDTFDILEKNGWRSNLRYDNKIGFGSPPDIQKIINELCEQIDRTYEPPVINEQAEIQKYYSMMVLDKEHKKKEKDDGHSMIISDIDDEYFMIISDIDDDIFNDDYSHSEGDYSDDISTV